MCQHLSTQTPPWAPLRAHLLYWEPLPYIWSLISIAVPFIHRESTYSIESHCALPVDSMCRPPPFNIHPHNLHLGPRPIYYGSLAPLRIYLNYRVTTLHLVSYSHCGTIAPSRATTPSCRFFRAGLEFEPLLWYYLLGAWIQSYTDTVFNLNTFGRATCLKFYPERSRYYVLIIINYFYYKT